MAKKKPVGKAGRYERIGGRDVITGRMVTAVTRVAKASLASSASSSVISKNAGRRDKQGVELNYATVAVLPEAQTVIKQSKLPQPTTSKFDARDFAKEILTTDRTIMEILAK